MKSSTFLMASLAASLFVQPASSLETGPKSAEIKSGAVESAQMYWRCGRNNPAEWGTFGNGCLKQKRAAKKGSSSTSQGSMSS